MSINMFSLRNQKTVQKTHLNSKFYYSRQQRLKPVNADILVGCLAVPSRIHVPFGCHPLKFGLR